MMHMTFPSTERNIEELLFHMPTVANLASNGWAKGFAQSIVKQSKRRGWRPTPKQVAMMRRLVSDLFAYRGDDDDLSLIE